MYDVYIHNKNWYKCLLIMAFLTMHAPNWERLGLAEQHTINVYFFISYQIESKKICVSIFLVWMKVIVVASQSLHSPRHGTFIPYWNITNNLNKWQSCTSAILKHSFNVSFTLQYFLSLYFIVILLYRYLL